MVSFKKSLNVKLANPVIPDLDAHMATVYAETAKLTSSTFRERSSEVDHVPTRQERRRSERLAAKQHRAIERMFRAYERARLTKDFEGPANQLERAFENAIRAKEEKARHGSQN